MSTSADVLAEAAEGAAAVEEAVERAEGLPELPAEELLRKEVRTCLRSTEVILAWL